MSENSHGRDPSGPGSCPTGEAAEASSSHSDRDPSRERMRCALLRILEMSDAADMHTEAVGAIDSLPETKSGWLRLLSSPTASKRYEAADWASRVLYDHDDAEIERALAARYEIEQNKLVRAVIRSAFRGAPQGIEARSAETSGSAEGESPVAEGHAPDLKAKSQESEESAA